MCENSRNINKDPAPPSSGLEKANAPVTSRRVWSNFYSENLDDALKPTPPRTREPSTVDNILPQFRAGAAIPNSVVRSRKTSLESPSEEKNIQQQKSYDVSIVDKLTKYIRRRPKIIKEDPVKKIEKLNKQLSKANKKEFENQNPEKENRRHKQRIMPDILVDWKRSHNFELIQKSIQESYTENKSIVTEEDIVRQQRLKTSSEPIPEKLDIKITSGSEVESTKQNIQVPDINKDSETDTREVNKASTESIQESSLSKSSVKESTINYISWQDIIRDLSEIEPLKRISLLNLKQMSPSFKTDQNEQDTEKIKKQRRSSSSQKRKSTDRSSIKLVKGSEALSQTEDEAASKKTSEVEAMRRGDVLEPSEGESLMHKIEKSSDTRKKKPRRRSKQSQKSVVASIGIKTKPETQEPEMFEMKEKFRASDMPQPSDIILVESFSLLHKPDISVGHIKLEEDTGINKSSEIYRKKQKKKIRKSEIRSSQEQDKSQIKDITAEEKSDEISEKSLLEHITLIESKQKKIESNTGIENNREDIRAQIESIAEKAKIVIAKRKQKSV
ncbi:hypothetical protein L9F63_018892 [Diploptera punctata]|uniref:Uncharacterized protein n=1 Tax=Diploptera punctata TaxID=6984 RepID=A0AAD7ZVX2_DIPPU|nr:hypothetical protein L9F63_018892 [Diploptera punctata]